MKRRRVCAALALLLLTACPSRDPDATETLSPSPTPPPSPVQGEIRVAYPWEPATLNPFIRGGDAPATRELVRPLLPPLFRTLPGGTVEPWLVERILSESAEEVRLRMRRDARWSDGRPIGVADLIFTWRTIMDGRWPIASRAGYDAIASIEEPAAGEARIRFTRPHAAWRDLFSAGLGVLPAHALQGKDFAAALRSDWPVSGGAFVLTRYIRGLEMIFEASPNPWRARPGVTRIRVQFVPDSTTALQLYRAGRVDVVGPYSSPDFARRLRTLDRARVTTDTGATWTGLLLATTTAPLSDTRVRRALALATDRDALVAGLVRAEGTRLATPFAAPDAAGATAAPHDPAAAASLLDAAGYRDRRDGVRRSGSRELTITIASVASDDLAARLVRGLFGRLRDAGFDASIVELEYEELWRDWLPSRRLQAALVRLTDPPGGALRARYHATQTHPAGINYAKIADPALDAALDDPSAAARKLDELTPIVPLYRVTVAAAARETVNGVRANASADGFLATIEEWRPAS